jgi:hypothetical protein
MFHAAVTGFIVAGMLGMMTALVVNPTSNAGMLRITSP